MLTRYVDWVLLQIRIQELSYFDSRGGLLPWSIGLGGARFYDEVIRNATIEPEAAPS